MQGADNYFGSQQTSVLLILQLGGSEARRKSLTFSAPWSLDHTKSDEIYQQAFFRIQFHLKFTWTCKVPRNTTTIFKEMNKVGGTTQPAVRLSIATVINPV